MVSSVAHGFRSAPNASGRSFRSRIGAFRTSAVASALALGALIPAGPAFADALTTIYRFAGNADGFQPTGNLVVDADGTVYGTTMGGGTSFQGTVYRLVPNAAHTAW